MQRGQFYVYLVKLLLLNTLWMIVNLLNHNGNYTVTI
jgi:hypothetical protein